VHRTPLRIKRTSRGISPQELSGRLGIDRDDLDGYEAGAERVGAHLLLRIAKLLDVTPDYFFVGYTEEELEGCLNLPLQWARHRRQRQRRLNRTGISQRSKLNSCYPVN
jgi:transcriptional regulator with XRE-family HTH domain